MKVKPEAFWFFRKGEFDDEKFQGDLSERIPKLYEQHGLIDFQVVKDTMVVDHSNGKAMLHVTVDEGPRYMVGTIEIVGNHHFTTDELMRYFPFQARSPDDHAASARACSAARTRTPNAFDQAAWDDATTGIRNAYSNEGYIYAQVRPVVERAMRDSLRVVNLRWEIDEKTPATVNRIEIVGNDYTNEVVHSRAAGDPAGRRVQPGPPDPQLSEHSEPELLRVAAAAARHEARERPGRRGRHLPGEGEAHREHQLRRVGWGRARAWADSSASTQPNLFGACKSASLQWQFGQFINDFQLSYTDPSVKQSRISATVTAYHTQSRYTIADLGQSTSTGASLQFGFPVRGSPFTRFFVSYGGEAVKFSGGLAARDTTINQQYNFRSTLGFTLTHDNRIDMPFASGGLGAIDHRAVQRRPVRRHRELPAVYH